jgi:uncharacterized protein YjeT (DUF2065 family)
MKSNASHQHSNQSMRISFGIIFVVIGLLLAFVGFNSFIDPVGAGLANYANPFTPAPRLESALLGLIGLVCAVVGVICVFKRPTKR